MSIHRFGFSTESLQKDKTDNRQKELESQAKLFNIKVMDMSDKLETRRERLKSALYLRLYLRRKRLFSFRNVA